jgi:lipopolysaccharide biosynthesis glycosyltransferase
MPGHSINIALSFDEGYAEQSAVMLVSLLLNNPQQHFSAFIFYSNLEPATLGRVSRNLSPYRNIEIKWIRIDESLIKQFYIRKGHVNEYAYSRIFMGDMLQNLDRFIYLDCDLLIRSSIYELWATDLHDKILGAVKDPAPFSLMRHESLQIPFSNEYFNSGVLLIDAKKWRARSCSQRVIKKLEELGEKAIYWDQDGLNAVLFDEWLPLDRRWNIQSHDIAVAKKRNNKNIADELAPHIIHFTGNLKPWNYKSSNPFKKEYYRYLKHTDFYHSHKPVNKTSINVVRRSIRNLLILTRLIK